MQQFATKKTAKSAPQAGETRADVATASQSVSGELVRGVGFALSGVQLVVPIDQVQEIVSCESVTRVPMTKPWLAGVTSIRSEAYTVCDLDSFISGATPEHAHQPNIIVLRAVEMRCALKVKRIIGLRQYVVVSDDPCAIELPTSLQPYVDGVVEVSGKSWCRFNIARLLTNPEFVRAELDEQPESILVS